MSQCQIRQAIIEDVPKIKTIADENREELGFIPSPRLKEAIDRRNLLVAQVKEQVVGFVVYRHRKTDLQTTLYDICVEEGERQRGFGTQLIMALISECRLTGREKLLLKCPIDLPANAFYAQRGFALTDVVIGKKRRLHVWSLDIQPDRSA